MSVRTRLPLAVTLGEPAGIGPDLTLAVWQRRVELDLPAFYLIGDLDFLARRARVLGLDLPLAAVAPAEATAAFERALPVVPLGLPVTAAPGNPDASSAPAAIASIRHAVADVMAGRAAAVVTNPIAKNVLYRSGFAEPGHTEFLAKLAAEATGQAMRPVMMLWSAELAVVPVTIHLPLRDVVSRLTSDLIVETGRIVARDLSARFGIAHPRLAVAGLNPHAGEEGALGEEDHTIVAPAVKELTGGGHRRRRPGAGRHAVPPTRARGLRCRTLHVSRPGADPDQDAGIRPCGERDPRPALRAHLARPRHRFRHRRHRPGQIRRA